jgi:integrase/recombinase XerD
MASRLIQQGESVETAQLLLRHAELDHVRPYLQVSQKRLEQMFKEAV